MGCCFVAPAKSASPSTGLLSMNDLRSLDFQSISILCIIIGVNSQYTLEFILLDWPIILAFTVRYWLTFLYSHWRRRRYCVPVFCTIVSAAATAGVWCRPLLLLHWLDKWFTISYISAVLKVIGAIKLENDEQCLPKMEYLAPFVRSE